MKHTLMLGAVLIALAIPVVAQDQNANTPPSSTPAATKPLTINQRRELQQQRIGEGVENGSLTAAEGARLERKEAGLNKEIRNMKKDGDFTAAERARVQRQQNRLSKQIYNQKHDAQRQPPAAGVIGQRARNQQQRIGEGIESGQLTAAEAARLERREAGINRRAANMAASGGTITRGERKAIAHRQNAASRAIYRQKHDNQRRR